MEGKLNQLFENFLNNQCSDQEILVLLEYFKLEQQEPMLRELIRQELKRSADPATEANNVQQHLDLAYANVRAYMEKDRVSVARTVKLRAVIAAVAAAVAVMLFGVYFFNYRNLKADSMQTSASNFKPGKVGATLTLANGKEIRLGDAVSGELANEAGVSITKSSDGQLIYEIKDKSGDSDKINTLSTAKGETYMLRLPDGSVVYLNAASSLTYTASLIEHGKRMVKLNGEGYFEIAKDKLHPFVVKTDEQEVEVLGTHFNINAYGDDLAEKTTLIEGSIKMTASGKQYILKPGQQGRLEAGRNTVSSVDTDLAIAWKNNFFKFEGESIETVMKMVERWYDVEVVYVGDKTNEKFSGGISRLNNLSGVLHTIETTGAVHFKVEGRKIYVK